MEPAHAVQTGEKPSDANVLIEEKDKPFSSLTDSLKIQESSGPSALGAPTQGQNQAQYCGDDSTLAQLLQSELNRGGDGSQGPKEQPKP